MAAYATPDDLTGVVNPVPTHAELLLRRASRAVDRALLCARYDPTDPAIVTALREATVEQVAGMLASGDKTGLGVMNEPQSFTIGKISVQRPATTEAPSTDGLVNQAYAVLQAAGLTGQGPQEPW